MKRQSQFRIVYMGVVFSLAAYLMNACIKSASSGPVEQSAGNPVEGLQLSLSLLPSEKAAPLLQVALRNKGDKDVNVNLGVMLANGAVQIPNRIHLLLTDPQHRKHDVELFDTRYPGVAGRADDYIVPLRSGSLYTLQVKLDPLLQSIDAPKQLTPGRYQVEALFQDDSSLRNNKDMPAIKLISLWQGKLLSNIITIEK